MKSIVEILTDADIPFKQKEKDNIYIDCPFCDRAEKLSINIFTGAWHCWATDCEKGSKEFKDLLKGTGLHGADFIPQAAPVKVKKLTQEETNMILHAAENKAEVIAWAASRCLDPKPLMKWGVGYIKEKRCISIPFRDPKNGKLIGARCRGDNGNQWLIGKEPPLFVIDPQDLKKEKVVIVEGEPDVFTLKQFGIPAVGVLGAGKVGGLNLLKSVRTPYLGFDMDSAGEEGVEKALIELGPYRCKRVHWSIQTNSITGDRLIVKDPNDMLKGGATREVFLDCLRNAKTPEIEVMSKAGSDAIDSYLEMKQTKKESGEMYWGYEGLDKCTKGLHAGWVVFLMMEGGFGKTTMLLNILVNNVIEGVKCGIASFEEHPEAEIVPKLMAMFVERNPGGADFDEQEIVFAREDLQHVYIYPDDDPDILRFQNWVRECYHVHGVRLIVADYLQMIVNESDGVHQLKKQCYQVGKDLVKEMPDLRIIWAVQPKQLSTQMHKGEKKRARLSMHDARGGTVIQQSCDVFLTGMPVEGHSDVIQCEFEKVRGQLMVSKKDWLYKITQLKYDHSTMRQYELKQLVYGGE